VVRSEYNIEESPKLMRVFSDLHLDFYPYDDGMFVPLETDRDSVLIIAGDLCEPHKKTKIENFLSISADRFAWVIVVLGNHDYYNSSLETAVGEYQKIAKDNCLNNVIVTDCATVNFENVSFICATLWTDYDNRDWFSMQAAKRGMLDYQTIMTIGDDGLSRRIVPEDLFCIHQTHKSFIDAQLMVRDNKKKIVVTHHIPSPASVHEKYSRSSINGCFASNLDSLILKHQPKFWIHGHTHEVFDYYIGETRVYCNPYGYYGHENTDKCDKASIFLL